jgi:hypothetical protein
MTLENERGRRAAADAPYLWNQTWTHSGRRIFFPIPLTADSRLDAPRRFTSRFRSDGAKRLMRDGRWSGADKHSVPPHFFSTACYRHGAALCDSTTTSTMFLLEIQARSASIGQRQGLWWLKRMRRCHHSRSQRRLNDWVLKDRPKQIRWKKRPVLAISDGRARCLRDPCGGAGRRNTGGSSGRVIRCARGRARVAASCL